MRSESKVEPPGRVPTKDAWGAEQGAAARTSASRQESKQTPEVAKKSVSIRSVALENLPVRVFKVSWTVRAGGAVLAWCAGIVNAVAFYALGTFVSHLTGTTTKVGLGLEDSAVANAGESTLLVVSFTVGSMLTGFLIAHDSIHFGLALYDICLLTEASLLVLATFLAEHKVARFLAAAACGLQNGMATHWGGAVIRTTHVTGLFTDVGLLLGRLGSLFFRKRCGSNFDGFDKMYVQDDLAKLSVLLTIASFFIAGAFVGAHLYNSMKQHAFLVPAGITGSIGLAYSVYRVFILGQRCFSDAEMEIVDVPDDMIEVDEESLEISELPLEADRIGLAGPGCLHVDPYGHHHQMRKESKNVVVSVPRECAVMMEQDLEKLEKLEKLERSSKRSSTK